MSRRFDFSARPAQGYDAGAEKEANTVGRAIQRARQSLSLSQSELAERLSTCGVFVQTAALSKWETGQTMPSPYQLFALCEILSIRNLDEVFLHRKAYDTSALNAIGEKKVQEYIADLTASGHYSPPSLHPQRRYRDLKLFDLPVSAGVGNFLDSESYEICSFAEEEIPRGTDYCLRIDGDSMEPRFYDREIVFVRQSEEVRPGEIGIFLYEGCAYIKKLVLTNPEKEEEEAFRSEDGTLQKKRYLVSLNPKYAPIPLSPHLPCRILGVVVGP